MMIDKEQPMRETLSDTVDFINDNLAIGEISEGIGALNTRVSAIEDFIESDSIGVAVGSTELHTPFPSQHVFLAVPLPENVDASDVVACIPSGASLSTSPEESAITTIAPGTVRFVNYWFENNSVVFHWLPNAGTAANYFYTFTGIVLYKGRSVE